MGISRMGTLGGVRVAYSFTAWTFHFNLTRVTGQQFATMVATQGVHGQITREKYERLLQQKYV
jgi:hypothetical protein